MYGSTGINIRAQADCSRSHPSTRNDLQIFLRALSHQFLPFRFMMLCCVFIVLTLLFIKPAYGCFQSTVTCTKKISQRVAICDFTMSFLQYIAFWNTVKLGYNELYGTINICSLYRYNREASCSKLPQYLLTAPRFGMSSLDIGYNINDVTLTLIILNPTPLMQLFSNCHQTVVKKLLVHTIVS